MTPWRGVGIAAPVAGLAMPVWGIIFWQGKRIGCVSPRIETSQILNFSLNLTLTRSAGNATLGPVDTGQDVTLAAGLAGEDDLSIDVGRVRSLRQLGHRDKGVRRALELYPRQSPCRGNGQRQCSGRGRASVGKGLRSWSGITLGHGVRRLCPVSRGLGSKPSAMTGSLG